MIARSWNGVAPTSENASKYIRHFEQDVLRVLREREGFVGAHLITRPSPQGIECHVVTMWMSMDSIRSFAGANAETAVVAEHAQELLSSWDRSVIHSEIRSYGA